MTSVDHKFHKNVVSVFDLLSVEQLTIPTYQRPYKWTTENISQLFADIATHSDKKAYRIGTIVFHQDQEQVPEVLNVVDGQQRSITLLLAAKALLENRQESIKRQDLRKHLEELSPLLERKLSELSFTNDISRRNINNNYLEISRLIKRPEFTEDHIYFLLHQCQVVTFVLKDISAAFQFFDSQNARGKDLSPHDLLKAYHLREFAEEDELLKAKAVSRWEETDSERLATLFSDYLFRIRNWSKGAPARYFCKDDVSLFKGVNLSRTEPFPYTNQLRITHHFVDHHRNHYERQIDLQHLPYPFQFDQVILNGRRFFEMIDHYLDKNSALTNSKTPLLDRSSLGEMAQQILNTIDNYDGRHRTGDKYVRNVFDCLLFYYIDKFGNAGLSQAIEKIFIWSYSLRLKMYSVQLASTDNFVRTQINLFVRLKEAIQPKDFIQATLPILEKVNSSNTAKIEHLFKKMGYLGKISISNE